LTKAKRAEKKREGKRCFVLDVFSGGGRRHVARRAAGSKKKEKITRLEKKKRNRVSRAPKEPAFRGGARGEEKDLTSAIAFGEGGGEGTTGGVAFGRREKGGRKGKERHPISKY